jgi:hypothetical protein
MHLSRLQDEEAAIPPLGPIPQAHPAGHGNGIPIAQAIDIATSMGFRDYDHVARNGEEVELDEVFCDAEEKVVGSLSIKMAQIETAGLSKDCVSI